MKNIHTFTGELFGEILIINGKKYEHVGFRSYDGWFENLLNQVAEEKKLPQKATITIKIHK